MYLCTDEKKVYIRSYHFICQMTPYDFEEALLIVHMVPIMPHNKLLA
jgi:hypothetical protein